MIGDLTESIQEQSSRPPRSLEACSSLGEDCVMKVKSCGEKCQRTEMMHLFQIVPASGRAHQMIPTHAFGRIHQNNSDEAKKDSRQEISHLITKKNAAPQRHSTVARKRPGLRFLVMSPSDFSLLPSLSHLAEWRWKSPASLKKELS